MPHRAFVFELVAAGRCLGAGAICPERRELAVWREGHPAPTTQVIRSTEWPRLKAELSTSLPTGHLPESSSVVEALVGGRDRHDVHVHYLGVFPIGAGAPLPASHPAGRVLQSWARPRGIG